MTLKTSVGQRQHSRTAYHRKNRKHNIRRNDQSGKFVWYHVKDIKISHTVCRQQMKQTERRNGVLGNLHHHRED